MARDAISKQKFDEAIVQLINANKIAAEFSDRSYKSALQLEVAELHYFLENYVKADNEADLALENLEKENDEILKAHAYNLKGLILTQLNELSKAENFFRRAENIYTSKGTEAQRACVLLGLGDLERKNGKLTDAINYYNATLAVFEENDMAFQLASAYLSKAEALIELEDPSTEASITAAAESLSEARVLIGKNAFTKLEVQSYKIASHIALKKGDLAEINTNLHLYETKNDSLQQAYLQAIAKGVEIESSVSSLKEKIEEQQTNIDKQQKSINFGRMTTGLSIALIIILSLLTLSLYKNNNLRAKANELLQDKNIELQLAKEKAEKASLAKAQFLSTITHELRTPLYAVTGLTHLLLEEDPKPHQKEHLNSLKFSGEYLLSLINNILDLNKLEANKVEIEKTTFSLKKRINDVLIALKKSADDRKNNLHLEYDETIPDRLVGDPLKLSQILINLIGNSVKFTQNGDVVVRVRKLEEKNSKVSLHFEIEDNGVGISKKKQKSIFETFSQASLQINRKFGGTGLGLSIVKNLLELMGSKINLESQLGKGSKFWFNINLDISEEVKEDINPKNIIYDVDYVALENRKILVVEDNKINQMITRKILEKNKMNCMVADNGMDAIKLVKENEFDVILMDIHMPGISGIEATQKIRAFNKDIPIIALTAVTIDENLDDFYRAGFNEIIPKPFKTEEFFEKIYRSISDKTFPVNS
ncbi:MAG: response regulator [Bacteroidia bacterium]|nr:response regulator [Bacteroidia bacterium]NNF30387.1 response regulator [Flavobacteriaceae bacterium]MBT8276463.1 response regulator [Bacteroidia bacterium]NNJ80719.1 response regulator [Flavobacteriaceae bacterium]NNK53468.1 response regulator [Flavobacteriaceae bacterium]